MARIGSLTVRQFDPFSQALAKLERGFDQDLEDVREMVARGLVVPRELARSLEAIADQLYRFPAVDPEHLRAAVAGLEGGPGPG